MFATLSDLKKDFINVFISLNYSSKNDGYYGDSFIFNFYVLRLVDDKLSFSFLWRNCTEKSPKFPVTYQQNSYKAGKMSNENSIWTGDISRLFFGLRVHL